MPGRVGACRWLPLKSPMRKTKMKMLRAAIVLVCAIGCLSNIAAAAEQSHGAASAVKGDGRHEADKPLFQQPISVSIVRSAEDERRLADGDHEELAKASNDKLVAYSTVALAVVTLALAIWTGL